MTALSKVCFCVLNAAYIDPAIVSLSSFFKFNDERVVCFYESGTDISRLKAALAGYEVDFRERVFPDFPEHKSVGDKYFPLFCGRENMPCYAARVMAIEELREEYDIAVNFDLDTLFFNTIEPLLEKVDEAAPVYLYGVSERKNRDRWVRNLGVSDVVPGRYINTGFVIYGAEAEEICLSGYQQFLSDFSDHIYCPEQDYINHVSQNRIREISPAYNLMFTNEAYTRISPVMVHFISNMKPWSDVFPVDNADFYFHRYRVACEAVRPYLSQKFNSQTYFARSGI
jgi:lipopolysaccharide biosynthesis glycosyltransferase